MGGDFRITRSMMTKFGETEGCKGCERSGDGTNTRHDAKCRTRFEKALLEDDILKYRILDREIRKEDAKIDKEEKQINLPADTVPAECGEGRSSTDGLDHRQRQTSRRKQEREEAEFENDGLRPVCPR